MLKNRIIPCLDIKRGKLVKGTRFKDIQTLDDPVVRAKQYALEGADELVVYDISAALDDKLISRALIKKIASEIDIPLTIGGGIKNLSDIEALFSIGADKVSINSGALKNPQLLREAALKYGNQSIVGSVDIKKDPSCPSGYRVMARGGGVDTQRDAIEWIKEMVSLGAGEIVVNTIDQDGVKKGFDLPFFKVLCHEVQVPLIASGGAGSADDFYQLFKETRVTAGLAASIFHLNLVSLKSLKTYLLEREVPVRWPL